MLFKAIFCDTVIEEEVNEVIFVTGRTETVWKKDITLLTFSPSKPCMNSC